MVGGVHVLVLFFTEVLVSKLDLPGKISSGSDLDASFSVLDVLVDDDDDFFDVVLDVVVDDDSNLFFSIPEDDGEDLVNTFLVAEDDNMSAILLAQFPKGRFCRAKADGSVEGWMSSLPSPWIFLFCAGL